MAAGITVNVFLDMKLWYIGTDVLKACCVHLQGIFDDWGVTGFSETFVLLPRKLILNALIRKFISVLYCYLSPPDIRYFDLAAYIKYLTCWSPSGALRVLRAEPDVQQQHFQPAV
jgi:hypothetical protein